MRNRDTDNINNNNIHSQELLHNNNVNNSNNRRLFVMSSPILNSSDETTTTSSTSSIDACSEESDALLELVDEWFEAIKLGNLEKAQSLYFEKLLPHSGYTGVGGIDVTTGDQWAYTALHWACQKGYFPICKFLIQNGAKADKKAQKVPWTPLLLAARYGHTDIVRYLLDVCHVNINEQIDCDSRYTALHYSCHHGHVEIVKLLLSYDSIDPTLTSGHGLRAIHTAANNNQVECLRAIIASGKENINARHDSDWAYTPLHWSCQENHLSIVQLLLESGADLYLLCGRQPLTALQIAKKSGNIQIVHYIEQFEQEQRSRYNFRVFCEYPLGTKRFLHMVNVHNVAELKQRMYTHFVLGGNGTTNARRSITDYIFEFYVSDFGDYALMEDENPEELPIYKYLNGNIVRIRITKRRHVGNSHREVIEDDHPAFEQFNNADLVHSFSSDSLTNTPRDNKACGDSKHQTRNQHRYSIVKQLSKHELLAADLEATNKGTVVKFIRQFKCHSMDQVNSIMDIFMQRNMIWSHDSHLCKYENIYLTSEDMTCEINNVNKCELLHGDVPSPRSDGVSNGRATSPISRHCSNAFIVNLVRQDYSLGSLEEFLAVRKRTTGITLGMSLQFMKQICAAVRSLHEAGYVHGSIKPSVIYFMDSDFNTLVLDQMAIASLEFENREDSTDHAEETLAYSAPECITEHYTNRSLTCDVWSIGCLLVELLGIPIEVKQLYNEALVNPVYLRTLSQELTLKYPDYSQLQPLLHLMCGMLAREPSDRPTIRHVVDALEQI